MSKKCHLPLHDKTALTSITKENCPITFSSFRNVNVNKLEYECQPFGNVNVNHLYINMKVEYKNLCQYSTKLCFTTVFVAFQQKLGRGGDLSPYLKQIFSYLTLRFGICLLRNEIFVIRWKWWKFHFDVTLVDKIQPFFLWQPDSIQYNRAFKLWEDKIEGHSYLVENLIE
jgi:hypothetical protein